jgi:ATP-dependent DNA ligase
MTGRRDWRGSPATERIKAESFTIDGEAVVLGPDGLSRFEELCRRAVARTAILYAFDPSMMARICAISHSWTGRLRWRGCCVILKRASCLTKHIVEDGLTVFAHACHLAPKAVSKKVDGTYRSCPCRVWIKVRNPASIAVQRERGEMWNR